MTSRRRISLFVAGRAARAERRGSVDPLYEAGEDPPPDETPDNALVLNDKVLQLNGNTLVLGA